MRLNPLSLMSLIVLVAFTLVMAVLTVVKSNQIRTFDEGDPDQPTFKKNSLLKDEATKLEGLIGGHKQAIALRQREIDHLDFGEIGTAAQPVKRHGIGQHGIYFNANGDLLSSVATPDLSEATINGKATKLKDGPWKIAADQVTGSSKRSDALKIQFESTDQQGNAPLDEAIRKRQDDLQAVLKKIGDGEARFSQERESLTKQLDELNAAKDKSEKKQRDMRSTRLTKISQLEDRIRGLLELELRWVADIEADGEILEGSGNQVIVNLGSQDKAFPGLLFEVATHSKGDYQRKGTIELIEVRDTISIARITAQDDPKRNPIGRGDQIGNPVFDARKPKVFHVAGEFKRYNNADLEQFIRLTGGQISPVLGPGCDFLVAGDRSDTQQGNARQYQVQAMKEDTLLNFVQTTFAPKAATR